MEPNNFGTVKIALLTLCTVLWFYWLWTRRHLYRFALKFPGYLGIPFLGCLHRIRALKYVLPEFGRMLDECKLGTILIWLGLYPVLLTTDPEIIEKVLSSNDLLNKPTVSAESLDKLFGCGLLSSRAEIWHYKRKLINPSFNHKVLLGFLPAFHKAKNTAVSKLDSLVDTGEHKIAKILQRISLSVSIETTMGKVMKEGDLVDEKLTDIYSFLLEKVCTLMFLSSIHLGASFGLYQRFRKSKKYLHSFVDQLVLRRLNSLNECKSYSAKQESADSQESQEAVLAIKKVPNIFIDQAVQLYQKQQIGWDDIIAESNTVVAASFETTAISVFSVILMLAMHTDVQEKLYEEIVGVFPDKDFQMDYEHMQLLPYLDRVINEMLRVMPSVPIIGRRLTEDTQLTQKLMVPKDLNICISIYHLHRRTDIWGPNANRFDPDHFLPERLADKHAYAFIPFSKGNRNCIGWRYALLSLKVMVAGLVRHFRFVTTFKFEDLQILPEVSLKYLNEPGIEIHRR